jgi:chemotaxis protein histidine kinase CheA/ActR/RegA family two-component response regulator
MNSNALVQLFLTEFEKDVPVFQNLQQRILHAQSDDEYQLAVQTYVVNLQRICDGAASIGLNGVYLYLQQICLNVYEAKAMGLDQQVLFENLYVFWLDFLVHYLYAALQEDATLIEVHTEMLLMELVPPNVLLEINEDDSQTLSKGLLQVIEMDEAIASLMNSMEDEKASILIYDEASLFMDWGGLNRNELRGLLQECEDNIELVSEKLSSFYTAIATEPHDPQRWISEYIQHAKRGAHTIKGSSQMAGLSRLSLLFHKLEDLFDYTDDSNFPWDAWKDPTLQTQINCVIEEGSLIIDALKEGAVEPSVEKTKKRLDNFLKVLNALFTHEMLPQDLVDAVAGSVEKTVRPIEDTQTPFPVKETAAIEISNNQLEDLFEGLSHSRVLLNRMKTYGLNLQGSLRSARLETEDLNNKLEGMSQFVTTYLLENKKNISSLEQRNYSEVYSMSIAIGETNNNMRTMLEHVNQMNERMYALLEEVERNDKSLSLKVLASQMIPFSTLSGRLKRIVSTTAQKCDKKVKFEILGETTRLEKHILEELKEPLMHLLRNAIDHGFQHQTEGKLRLSVKSIGQKVLLTLIDNGQGLSVERIKQKAIDSQRLSVEQAAQLNDVHAMNLIFTSGFSTKDKVTEISGRGVGLDIVKRKIESLGGQIEVANNVDKGASFSLVVPSNMASVNAMITKISDQYFAIPSAFVDRILDSGSFKFQQFINGQASVVEQDAPWSHIAWEQDNKTMYTRSVRLSQFAKMALPAYTFSAPKAILMRYAEEWLAVLVDDVSLIDDLIVKKIQSVGRTKQWIIGTTIQTDGSVVPILNIPNLLNTAGSNQIYQSNAITAKKSVKPKILVVDDSLFMRDFLQEEVQEMGFEPILAIHGLDAIEKLKTNEVQLVLTDLEMPEMDGLNLSKYLKHNDAYKHLPIFMITSRSTERYKKQAHDAGIDVFMSKPFTAEILEKNIVKWMQKDKG